MFWIQIGPDPARFAKFAEIQPPTTIKGIRSLPGMIAKLGKFCPDYAMSAQKLRGLLCKNVKFCWTNSHEAEFDNVISNLSKLEHLVQYKKGNKMVAMTDASMAGLGFILFQKDSAGQHSILQVGSTCLKHAHSRWHPAELELLTFQHYLKKCHFYTT